MPPPKLSHNIEPNKDKTMTEPEKNHFTALLNSQAHFSTESTIWDHEDFQECSAEAKAVLLLFTMVPRSIFWSKSVVAKITGTEATSVYDVIRNYSHLICEMRLYTTASSPQTQQEAL